MTKFRIHFCKLSFSFFFVGTILLTSAGAPVFAFYGPSASGRQGISRRTPLADRPVHSKVTDYARLPLAFEPNQGQAGGRAKFLAHGSGYTLHLGATDASVVLGGDQRGVKPAVLRMKLAGARLEATITGADQLPGKVNYLLGNDPAKWHTGIPTFSRVQYNAIYPGVDLVYYGNQQRLEYDFVLEAGAHSKAIRLEYPGAERLRIAANGDLLIKVAGREIRQQTPRIYQENRGTRTQVRGRYVLLSRGQVGFLVGGYNHRQRLTIDPALVFSTVIGGSSGAAGTAIALDSSGSAYITGTTRSADFPTTAGVFQATDPGPFDHAFVSKLNPAGSALVYSTYLGGTNHLTSAGGSFPQEGGLGIKVTPAGNVVVAGVTDTTNFPTTAGAFRATSGGCTTFSSDCDGFVTELSADGSALVYSTYVGGSGSDEINAVAIDSAGNIYVAGNTSSIDFPTTPGALQTQQNGSPFLAFVSKFDPTKTGSASLVYSTYLGGATDAFAEAIAVDSAGNAYVGGGAEDTTDKFPGTPGAFQSNTGLPAFVTKINPSGSALVYSARIGGIQKVFGSGIIPSSEVNGIALDASGNVFIVGRTNAFDFPTTPGVFIPQIDGGRTPGAGFAAKLNSTGSSLIYSTFLAGSNPPNGSSENNLNSATAVAVDSSGSAYITGVTGSILFPTSAVTLDPICGDGGCGTGNGDAFITVLSPSGAMVFSTFLGTSSNDVGNGIAVDGTGNIFVVGVTNGRDFPVTPGAFKDPNLTFGGAFVSKISITAPGAAAGLFPGTLQFPPEAVGTAAPTQPAVLRNRGSAPLTISNIAFTGTGFSQTNNCPAVLAPAASCTFNFGFTPNAVANFTGQALVTDNAVGSPNIVNLTGAGGTPAGILSATSLTFGSQVLNNVSSPQSITIDNSSGTADLQISSIQVTGDFAQTNTCGTTVAAGTNCAVNVTFKPTTLGSRSGLVSINDNASSSPQTILLGGTGIDFTLSATSSSAAIAAGQSASYTLNIAPTGTFTQPIALSCTGAPAAASCAVTPNSITPTGSSPITAAVSVTTTARGQSVPFSWSPGSKSPVVFFLAFLGLAFLLLSSVRSKREWRACLGTAALALIVLSLAGCGGGNSGGGGSQGTPPGTYSLTVTATSGTASKTMGLSLTVN